MASATAGATRRSNTPQHAGSGGSCTERHHGYLISARMLFRRDDGRELEARGGDIYLIPPGHDPWVVESEPCVALDLRAVADASV